MCNMKYDHPILAKTLELHSELTRDGKETVFVWVSGHVGIRANSAADSVAKDVHDGDFSDDFSDVEPRENKYALELWRLEWNEYPHSWLHKLFPNLNDCISCPRTNRREETNLP